MISLLSDADLLEMAAIHEARESFYAFYRLMNPKFKTGWWQKEVCGVLQQFYVDLRNGLKPAYVIEAPPQHGKSKLVVTFIAWISGQDPDLKTIYTSFSDRLGVRANLTLQRIYDSSKFKKVFPEFKISSVGSPNVKNSTRTRDLIEYIDADGFFRNTTVRGSITGESLDVGVIDDPIKGREAAGSKSIRDKTWEWMTDDFLTRFSEEAGFLAILTRWHIDDPIGRLKETSQGNVKTYTYRAIATTNEKNRKEGEALFPEHKSLEFLQQRKELMSSASWESLYQQNPRVIEGEMIKRSWFDGKRYNARPSNPIKVVQSWDTANKAAALNDPSVCSTWIETEVGYYLVDVLVLKGEYPVIKRAVINKYIQFQEMGLTPSAVLIEDKSSGQSIIQELRSGTTPIIPVIAINPCSDKITRMSIASDLIEAGRVWLPESAPWLIDYEEELFSFPRAKHDDQVDSTSQFLNWVVSKKPILIG